MQAASAWAVGHPGHKSAAGDPSAVKVTQLHCIVLPGALAPWAVPPALKGRSRKLKLELGPCQQQPAEQWGSGTQAGAQGLQISPLQAVGCQSDSLDLYKCFQTHPVGPPKL